MTSADDTPSAPDEALLARVEAYLDGELPPAERAAFEVAARADPMLAGLLADYERSRRVVRAAGMARLKARLQAADRQLPAAEEAGGSAGSGEAPAAPPARLVTNRPPAARSLWLTWRTWAAAAVLVLTIGVGWWNWNTRVADPQQLFAAYYDAPYPNVAEPIVRGDHVNTIRARAFAAYEAADYATALRGFETLLQDDNIDDVLHLYAGTAALAQDSAEVALRHLRQVPVNSTWRPPAAWYQALAALRAGRLPEARPPLKELVEGTSAYTDRARRLLDEL